jgi:hypothetical protein
MKLSFSPDARGALESLSAEGQAFLKASLLRALEATPKEPHLHAGGMCILLEAGHDGTVFVTAVGPGCLKMR